MASHNKHRIIAQDKDYIVLILDCFAFARNDEKITCIVEYITQNDEKITCNVEYITQNDEKITCNVEYITQNDEIITCMIELESTSKDSSFHPWMQITRRGD